MSKLVTMKMWEEAGSFEKIAEPGDSVEESIVNDFLNCVPPALMKAGFIQAGEPYSHVPDENGRWRATYVTFFKSDGTWHFAGHCYLGKTEPAEERSRVIVSREAEEESFKVYSLERVMASSPVKMDEIFEDAIPYEKEIREEYGGYAFGYFDRRNEYDYAPFLVKFSDKLKKAFEGLYMPGGINVELFSRDDGEWLIKFSPNDIIASRFLRTTAEEAEKLYQKVKR